MFEIVSEIVDGDVVVMGASLGGWLSLLSAVRFPNKVVFIMWTEGTQIKPPLIGARIEKAEAVRKNKIIPMV